MASTFLFKGKYRTKATVPGVGRLQFTLATCTTKEEADARADLLERLATTISMSGHGELARRVLTEVATAESPRIKVILEAAGKLIATKPPPKPLPQAPTIKDFAHAWSSGELHERWPDHVKLKSSAAEDKLRFDAYILPLIGDVPIKDFALSHAELVMASIPEIKSTATRRHIAQLMHRLAAIAVYPGKFLAANPLPKGFLPPVRNAKATAYLYPSEDARLLACTEIPLVRRMLYGVLAREGLRYSEAIQLEWSSLDLENGSLTLDENKTDDPRAWAIGGDVKRALEQWKKLGQSPKPFPIKKTRSEHQADQFREDLRKAGITRPVLFERTESRLPIRVHDLRATFITLSLAADKSETWVADRTGHKSSTQINRYRRQARMAAELHLGQLSPMNITVPELSNPSV